MYKFPEIGVSFFLTADEFNLDYITIKMGIIPTEARTKDDFPCQDFAHTSWSIDILEEECYTVDKPFDKLLGLLDGKEKIIISLCEELGIKASFSIVIHMNSGRNPEIVLSNKIISFASSINAHEIGFDIYSYEIDEIVVIE